MKALVRGIGAARPSLGWKKGVVGLGFFLAWFASGSLFAADPGAGTAISSQELAVVKAVVLKLCGSSCGIDPVTMPAGHLDAEMLAAAGMAPAPEGLLEDFKARNSAPRSLPADFQKTDTTGLVSVPGERKRCLVSRPGFDKAGTRALVLVKRVFIYPEDIMNEGMLVLLTQKDGAWSVEKSGEAWGMRLGK